MKKLGRISILAILAIIISIVSLSMSLVALYKLNNSQGIASVSFWNSDVEISLLDNAIASSNTARFLTDPSVTDNVITYGVALNEVNSYVQFTFQVCNIGNRDVKIKDILITGLEDYSEYVELKISGISVGDIIEKETNSEVIKVNTLYRNLKLGLNSDYVIKLDSIKISIIYEEV